MRLGGPQLVLLVAVLLGAAAHPSLAQDTGTDVPCLGSATDLRPDPGAGVTTWTGEVDGNITAGDLEVRSYHHGLAILPWNRSAWRVDVAEQDPRDELAVTVEATGSGRPFGLVVAVEPRDQRMVGLPILTTDARAQVVVHVPHLRYQAVVAADRPTTDSGGLAGPGGPAGSTTWDHVEVRDLAAEDLTVEVGVRDVNLRNVTGGVLSASTSTGDVRAVGPRGSGLHLATQNGDVCLQDARAATTEVRTANGDVALASVQADRTLLATQNGDLRASLLWTTWLNVTSSSGSVLLDDVTAREALVGGENNAVDARGFRVANLTYDVTNGGLDADLVPVTSGRWDLRTANGEVRLHVPTGDRYGYDALVRTQNGEPQLEIPGTEVVSRDRTYVHARTVGYDDRAIRTELRVESQNGGVTADDAVRSHGVPLPAVTPEAAAAGATVGLLALLLAFWAKGKAFLAPLYTRLSRSDLLDHPTRRRILEVAREEPGVHFREMERRVGAGRGILEHHLVKLVDAGLLAERNASGYRCYFPTGTVDRRVMDVTDRVRSESARALLRAAVALPDASVGELARRAGLSDATASYHLKRLTEAGLVSKRRTGTALAVRLTDLGERAVRDLRLA